MRKKTMIAAFAAVLVCLIAIGCAESVAAGDGRFKLARYDTAHVITDTYTGVQYMYYYNARGGGITVLVDAEGKPLLQEKQNADKRND